VTSPLEAIPLLRMLDVAKAVIFHHMNRPLHHRALLVACLAGLACAGAVSADDPTLTEATPDYAAWAVDPTAPGPDLPPAGRSVFDQLVTDRTAGGAAYRIPFPFWTLIDQIGAQLTQQEYAGGTRTTLIPMGRSLQRAAAAPDFFLYPRTVVAVTGEPITSEHDAGLLLKDRLYIGYVEKTATLEVISYNEAAGRFEFQLVKDYRAGAQPKVFYANRAICTSCHQNQAPIFSVAVWSETTANGRVATLLGSRLSALQLPRQSNLDFPDDINKAAVRANALLPLQRAWQHGCADMADRARSQRCRARAFIALLQYGLTGERDFDSGAADYLRDFVGTLAKVWRERWPAGMSVGQSDLPDRNPFGGASATYGGGSEESSLDWTAAAHVPAQLDPLNPRPAREVWHFAGAMDAPRLIAGWSKFFAADDFRALNAYLLEQGARVGAPATVYRGACTVTRDPPATSELKLKCIRSHGIGVHLAGRFDGAGGGRIGWLDLGPAGQLRDIPFEHTPVQRVGSEYILHAAAKGQTLAARLPDGRSLTAFEVRWPVTAAKEAEPLAATIEISVTDDFALARQAVDRLLEKHPSVFDEAPLARSRLMRALSSELGMPDRAWCCADDDAMPPAQVDQAVVNPSAIAQHELQPFFRYCSVCHLTRETFPPNFLAGDERQVAAYLRQCAPRMLVRLAAWRTPIEQRAKTPMPPVTAIQALGTTPEHWMRSQELEQLRGYVESLTRQQGRPADMAGLLKDGYEALPRCLPAR